ncbi:MAG: phosphohistidine phosphatase [Verrucomicrobiota bacterium]|jgi:phosphohistidine phosphatase
MTIYLLRHGLAVERGHGDPRLDPARPLTKTGRRKLARVAAAMRAMELSFDAVLSSPLVRAWQTADVVLGELRSKCKVRRTRHLSPGGSVAALVRELKSLKPVPASVLLVGHEPHLSGVASVWLTGGRGLTVTMKKGGLCKLIIDQLRTRRCASLEWLLPPRLSGLME